MSFLADSQQKLSEHFKQLAAERQEKIFLLEHPFSQDEIVDIKNFIRENTSGVKNKIFDLGWLLLVLLTEHAYRYEGHGTDFWNKFETDLEIPPFTIPQRTNLRDHLFSRAREVWNVSKPLDTDWARQFSIIAHPIANAVLPLDCRLPLTETLAAIPQRYFEGNEQTEILSFVKSHYPSSFSKRFDNWRQSFPFVNEFVLALACETNIPHLLRAETLNRIRQDIENDKTAGLSLRDFRRKYQRWRESQPAPCPAAIAVKPTIKKPVYHGTLFVRKDGEEWKLEGRLHQKCQDVFRDAALKRDLQYGRWKPQAWDCFKVKPAAFLQQDRFEIPQKHWSKINDGIPFVQAPDDCGSGMKKSIEAFRFKLEYPAVFEPLDDNLWKHCSAKIIVDSGVYVCIIQGGLRGIRTIKMDSAKVADLDVARQHGIEVVEPQCWKWIVPFGKIDKHERTITLTKNEPFFLHIENEKEVCINGLSVMGMVAFDSSDHKIHIEGETWTVMSTDLPDHRDYFTANLNGDLTVGNLKKRELSLTVGSPYPFMNVNYGITLRCGKTAISYTGLLEDFPSEIGKKKLLAKMFAEESDALYALFAGQENLQLVLDIQGVYLKKWTLESVLYGIWWEHDVKNNPVAKSDDAEYTVEEILHKDRYPLYDEKFLLYRANEKEAFLPVHRAETILRCPNELKHGGSILHLPQRIHRQANDSVSSVGLANIVDDILAFRQARTENPVAELQRVGILGELEAAFWKITCGKKWYEVSTEQNTQSLSNIYGRGFLKLLYPPEMGKKAFKYGGNRKTTNELVELFETLQSEFLSDNPYRKLWEKGVTVNALFLFLQPSSFQADIRDKMCHALLLDRQASRLLSFLIWQQRYYEQAEFIEKECDTKI